MWWRGILEDCADKQLHRRTGHPRTKGYPVAFEVYRACGMEPQDLIAAKFGGSKRKGEKKKKSTQHSHIVRREHVQNGEVISQQTTRQEARGYWS